MKKILNRTSYKIDKSNKRHYEVKDIDSIIFNRIRQEYQGKEFGNYEMMLLLWKKFDTYRSLDSVHILAKHGCIMRKSRGVYMFTEKPIYKEVLYKALVELRNKHLN